MTLLPETGKKEKEKTTRFGINLMRSQVLYRAAQMPETAALMCNHDVRCACSTPATMYMCLFCEGLNSIIFICLLHAPHIELGALF